MLVRKANFEDSKIIYEWRNDKISRKMSISNDKILYEKHVEWLKEILSNASKYLYIGEINNDPIGVCRFELNLDKKIFEVSINISPYKRGKGLGKILLKAAIYYFKKKNQGDLIAKVKLSNEASKKIFKNAGFIIHKKKKQVIEYILKQNNLTFKQVVNKDIIVLYEILKKRNYSISHHSMPSFEEHKKFVLGKPYRYWYLIFENEAPEGTFYIQKNNSIGINIFTPTSSKITKILDFIGIKFKPNTAIPSIVPNYFYINVAEKNTNLVRILEKIGCISIQKSFKLNFKDKKNV